MMILSSTNSWGMMQEILEEEEMRARERIIKKEQEDSVRGEETINPLSSNPAILNE